MHVTLLFLLNKKQRLLLLFKATLTRYSYMKINLPLPYIYHLLSLGRGLARTRGRSSLLAGRRAFGDLDSALLLRLGGDSGVEGGVEPERDKMQRAADEEDRLRGHALTAEEDHEHEHVERDAEDVAHAGARLLGDVLRAQRAVRGPEHAARGLEEQEGGENEERGRGAQGGGEDRYGGAAVDEVRHDADGVRGSDEREDGGADHDAHHEAGEDDAEGDLNRSRGGVGASGSVGRDKSRGPHEDEGIHRALVDGLSGAQERNLLARRERRPRGLHRARNVRGLVAVVLFPARDEQREHRKWARGAHERGRKAEGVGGKRCDETRDDGDDAVALRGLAEGVAEQGRGEAAAVVLGDHPGLEGGEEQGRRHTAAEAAKQQHGEGVDKLGERGSGVEHGEQQAHALAAVLVAESADESADEHGRREAGDEQESNLGTGEAVAGVERVDVGALEPVREHGKQVHREPGTLEGAEFRRRGILGVVLTLALALGLGRLLAVEVQRRTHGNAADQDRPVHGLGMRHTRQA